MIRSHPVLGIVKPARYIWFRGLLDPGTPLCEKDRSFRILDFLAGIHRIPIDRSSCILEGWSASLEKLTLYFVH